MAASVGENSKWVKKFKMAANDDEIPGFFRSTPQKNYDAPPGAKLGL